MATLNADQRQNAQIIISVGRQLGASNRDIQIALMAALVESGLRSGYTEARSNLDSAGLFQQRRAWAPGGSEAYRMNAHNAARMFFTGGHQGQRGLFDFRNRDRMGMGAAAQAVQVSAFPTKYAARERDAASIMGIPQMEQLSGRTRSGGWVRPVSNGRVTQNFGDLPPAGVTYAGGRKNGMSLAAAHGTPVYAASDGKVVNVTSGGAYGNRIEIAHGGKTWTLYAHLSGTQVRVGDTVRAGQVIGAIGSTGQTTGPHLHFEVRSGSNTYGAAVDPRGYLNNNSTPEAYINDYGGFQDFESETTTVVQGRAIDFMSTPGSLEEMQFRPYVYSSPYMDPSIISSMWAQPADPLYQFNVGELGGGEAGSMLEDAEEEDNLAGVTTSAVLEQEAV